MKSVFESKSCHSKGNQTQGLEQIAKYEWEKIPAQNHKNLFQSGGFKKRLVAKVCVRTTKYKAFTTVQVIFLIFVFKVVTWKLKKNVILKESDGNV